MYNFNYKSKEQESYDNLLNCEIPPKESPYVGLFLLIKLLMSAVKSKKREGKDNFQKDFNRDSINNDNINFVSLINNVDLNDILSFNPNISEPVETKEYNKEEEVIIPVKTEEDPLPMSDLGQVDCDSPDGEVENNDYNSTNTQVENYNNDSTDTEIEFENNSCEEAPLSTLLREDYTGVKVCAILPTGVVVSGEVLSKHYNVISLKHDNTTIFVNEKDILYFY
ncbi:hypothetical protein [Clostridium sp.]|uniref:hypothetical protein n=1 Tax=Clostridium sp. TaxID=1506 RepID=UPI002FCA0521